MQLPAVRMLPAFWEAVGECIGPSARKERGPQDDNDVYGGKIYCVIRKFLLLLNVPFGVVTMMGR